MRQDAVEDRDLALTERRRWQKDCYRALQLSLQIESRRLICEREIALVTAVHVVQFQLR